MQWNHSKGFVKYYKRNKRKRFDKKNTNPAWSYLGKAEKLSSYFHITRTHVFVNESGFERIGDRGLINPTVLNL